MTKQTVKKCSILLLALAMVACLCLGLMMFKPQTIANAATTAPYSDLDTTVTNKTTWTFTNGPTSDVKVGNYYSGGNNDNGLIFDGAGDSSGAKFKIGNLSCLQGAKIYIPVPAGNKGNIAMTTTSGSDTRHFLLQGKTGYTYVLWSKYSADAADTAAGKRGPQNFDFESTDLTLYNGNYYLILVAVSGEMKVGSFTLTVIPSTASVTYNANGGEGSVVDASSPYAINAEVTVLDDTGLTAPNGKAFAGWNTAANGSGTAYAAGAKFAITENQTLYAQWNTIIDSVANPLDVTKLLATVNTNGVVLPTQLPATCADDTTVNLTVSWDNATVIPDPIVVGDYTLTGTLQETAPVGYVFDDLCNDTVTLEYRIISEPIAITAVEAIPAIVVPVGTESIDELLPNSIECTTASGTVNLPFMNTWTKYYNLDVVNTTTFYTVNSIKLIDDEMNILYTIADEEVRIDVIVYSYEISSPETFADIEIRRGGSVDGLDALLPSVVEVDAAYGEITDTTELSVVWDTASVNLAVSNTYTIEGTITATTLYANTSSVKASIKIVVCDYDIESVETLANKNIFVNTTTNAGLPAEVEVTYNTDETDMLSVVWDTDEITFNAISSTTVYGTLTLKDGLTNTSNLQAEIVVNIIAYTSASTARSTDFITTYPANMAAGETKNFRGYEISVGEGGSVVGGDANVKFAGLKLKNATVVFTLERAAKVSFAIFEAKSGNVTFCKVEKTEPTAAWTNVGTPEAVSDTVNTTEDTSVTKTTVKNLEAGSYRIEWTQTSGAAIKYINIDDGGSEIFVAQHATETTAVLPISAEKKTIDTVEYKFYGYTDALGSNIYQPGASVTASVDGTMYYAIYAIGNVVDGAAIRISATQKAIKFSCGLEALNGNIFLNGLLTNEKIAFDFVTTKNGTACDKTFASQLNGTALDGTAVIEIDDIYATFKADISVSVNSNNIATKSITRTGDYIATRALADLSETQTAPFIYEDGTKFSRYDAFNRELLNSYLVAKTDITSIKANANIALTTEDTAVDLTLPSTVTVVYGAENTEKTVAVTWNNTVITYGTAGSYTVNGTIDLTFVVGLSNTQNLTASVVVVISAPAPVAQEISFVNPNAVEVVYNSAATALELPTTVAVTYGTEGQRNINVTWSADDIAALSFTTLTTPQAVTGTLDLSTHTDLVNAEGETVVTINVVVVVAEIDVPTLDNVQIAQNGMFINLLVTGVYETIELTYANGTQEVAVTWDTDDMASVDTTAAVGTTYEITGTFDITAYPQFVNEVGANTVTVLVEIMSPAA